MPNLQKSTVDHIAAVLTKELALCTGWNRERLAMLQSRIHRILLDELKEFIPVEAKDGAL